MKRILQKIPRYKTLLNAPRFLSDPIRLMEENIQRYGDTYAFMMGKHPAIFTADPGLIQHVLQKQHKKYIKSPPHFEKLAKYLGYGLLTIDGDHWLRQRRLIQPGFSRKRIAGLTSIMNTVIDEFLVDLDHRIEAGPIDLYEEMQQLAFNLVARSIFNLHIDQDQLSQISAQIAYLQQYVIKEIRTPFLLPWLQLSGQKQAAERAASEADAIILQFIRERRQSTETYDDLLQMLLEARYEDTGAPMSEQQLLDEVKILFVAGHDTTGNALSWIWHLLAQHPEWTQQLRLEIDQVLGGKLPTYADIPNLSKTRQVIEEAMRLYPPAWITDRVAIADDHYQGLDIPEGTMLITFFYGAHHHPDYWSEPNRFRPERFAQAAGDNNRRLAYMPFGAGPRLCIGHHFAILEMTLVLVRMVGRYDWEPQYETMEKLALVTLKPKQEVRMQAKKKSES